MRLSIIVQRKVKRSVTSLARLACMVALLGLAIFAASLFHPRPLLVIFSMSVGHAIGALAVILYGLTVVLDTLRSDQSAGGNPKAARDTGRTADAPSDTVR